MKRLIALVMVLTTGCVPLINQRQETQIYRLEPPRVQATQGPMVDARLLIDEPVTTPALGSDRIVVHPEDNLLQYYSGARWAARLPQLIRDHLIEAFELSGSIREVRRISGAVGGDFQLSGEVRDFQAEYDATSLLPQVHIRIQMQLIDHQRNRVLDSREFSRQRRSDSAEVLDVVRVMDTELQALMTDVVNWAHQGINRHLEQRD